MEKSPKRKRKSNRKEWNDVKSKQLLNAGVEHCNRKGKIIKAKNLGPPCTDKCRMKCIDKFNNDVRKTIFDLYWGLGTHTRQRDFITKYIKIIEKKQITISIASQSRRKKSRKYYLPINNLEIQVCQKMFLQTLAISDKVVDNVCKRLITSPVLNKDMRGKHSNRPLSIKEDVKNAIRKHINSFPIVDSHYVSENTAKKYLESGLCISKMYRLYLKWILDEPLTNSNNSVINATLRQYTDIFNTEFNLSFFKPKKDQCDVCKVYKLACPEEKLKQKDLYDEHLLNKSSARKLKNEDKRRALADPTFCVAVFDLQKVLTAPQCEVSSFYYKRKYATYNFTIFDIGKRQGYCYMWTESDAKRGSNEIATCLLKFMTLMKDSGIKAFSFYSDNCGGQNRNRFIYSM